jgi:signal transduction histidine kinase
MATLALWLKAHKDRLVLLSLQELTTQESLRQEAAGPVKWFFDSLIQAISQGENERLESLLRNWVRMCSIPINGQPVGLLPVLGVFKRAIWRVFQADPPSEEPLAVAAQLDAAVGTAAEYLSKVEAAALLDAFTHQMAVQSGSGSNSVDDTKRTFVSVAAHELKTPLTVIEGYANMLKIDLPEAAHPREALMIRGIESGIVRLRELIEDMVDVSLIEIDLLRLEMQPVWLPSLLDVVETEVREAVKARKLTLEIKRDTIPTGPIVGDPERLLKAFLKVLGNAIKYTPDGGRIVVHGRTLNAFVEIIVEDTGIGIAPEYLDTIFEKFSIVGDASLHSSGKVKFKGGGAGLGLVVAKGIVEAHGGSLWAESPGVDEEKLPGSRFHFIIPARDVRAGEGMAPMVAKAASLLSTHAAHSAPVAAVESLSPASACQKEESVAAGESRSLPVVVTTAKNSSEDGKKPQQEPARDAGRSTP